MYITESAKEYVDSLRLPECLRRAALYYIKNFLNSLDYIAIPDARTKQKLELEGVFRPQFYIIPHRETGEKQKAVLWLKLYREMAGGNNIFHPSGTSL